jgi:hypothetical protein
MAQAIVAAPSAPAVNEYSLGDDLIAVCQIQPFGDGTFTETERPRTDSSRSLNVGREWRNAHAGI